MAWAASAPAIPKSLHPAVMTRSAIRFPCKRSSRAFQCARNILKLFRTIFSIRTPPAIGTASWRKRLEKSPTSPADLKSRAVVISRISARSTTSTCMHGTLSMPKSPTPACSARTGFCSKARSFHGPCRSGLTPSGCRSPRSAMATHRRTITRKSTHTGMKKSRTRPMVRLWPTMSSPRV